MSTIMNTRRVILESTFCDKKDISLFFIETVMESNNSFEYRITPMESLIISVVDERRQDSDVKCYIVAFVQTTDNDSSIMEHPQYYTDKSTAVKSFHHRLHSRVGTEYQIYPSLDFPGEKLEDIRIKQTGELVFSSHYDYLDLMLNPFWNEVFGKTADAMFHGGMVSAHGDKCYCSKSAWLAHGITFQHGALLYLLSRTKELGSHPQHQVEQWVIDNYQKYLPKIKAAEKFVLKTKFNYKGN